MTWAYRVFSLSLGTTLHYGFWNLLPLHHDSAFIFTRSLGVSQFLCWISWLGHTTLEGYVNLDLQLYGVGVLISHRNPNITNIFWNWEKIKSFLWLPRNGGAEGGSHLQLSVLTGPKLCLLYPWRCSNSSLSILQIVCPFEQMGKNKFVSTWCC